MILTGFYDEASIAAFEADLRRPAPRPRARARARRPPVEGEGSPPRPVMSKNRVFQGHANRHDRPARWARCGQQRGLGRAISLSRRRPIVGFLCHGLRRASRWRFKTPSTRARARCPSRHRRPTTRPARRPSPTSSPSHQGSRGVLWHADGEGDPREIAEGDRRHHAPDSGGACSDGATAFSLTPAFLSRLCQAGERIPGRHPEDAAAGKLRWRQGSWTTQVQ